MVEPIVDKECCALTLLGNMVASVITISSIKTLAMSIIVAVNAQILPYSKGIRIFLKTLAIILSVISSLAILLCIGVGGISGIMVCGCALNDAREKKKS